MPERAVNYKSHMKVLKFGGTSVGSNENIKRIIGIVRKEKNRAKKSFWYVQHSAR